MHIPSTKPTSSNFSSDEFYFVSGVSGAPAASSSAWPFSGASSLFSFEHSLPPDETAEEWDARAKEQSDQGKVFLALKYKKNALELRKKLLGDEHPAVANDLDIAGDYSFKLYYYDTALKYYKEAVEIRKKLLNPEHLDTAKNVKRHLDLAQSLDHVVSSLLIQKKNSKETLAYCEESLKIKERFLGFAPHRLVAKNYSTLGLIYSELKKYDLALASYTKAVQIREKLPGPNNLIMAGDLTSLGKTYCFLEKPAEGLPYLVRALEIKKERLGPRHPTLEKDLERLVQKLKDLGKNAETLPYLENLLQVRQRKYGREGIRIALAYNTTGLVYARLQNYTEALVCHQRALEIRKKLSNPKDLDMVIYLANVGWSLGALGNYAEALEYIQEAVELSYDLSKRGSIIKCLQVAIHVLKQTPDKELVEKTKVELYPRCAKILGEDHPEVQAFLAVKAKVNKRIIPLHPVR